MILSNTKTYFSPGKLLLTGEYVVLDGAKAVAIPTKLGQYLSIAESDITTKTMLWQSFDCNEKLWFTASFNLENFSTISTTEIASTLSKILKTARTLNPNFLKTSNNLEVKTHLQFPRNWGLGSSSTLVNNIAQWANVDVYELLKLSFGGSGYDVAVAKKKSPIVYSLEDQNPTSKTIALDWDFKESLFFVHLNKKQNSKEGIQLYRETSVSKKVIETISDYSKKLLLCYTLNDFEALLNAHEKKIANLLSIPTIKQSLFPDFKNTIKSLGAWGGDFILATGSKEDMNYFKKKGFTTIIAYRDMILQ